jgi:ribose-phosphate pyrophosphokinase
LPAPPRHNSPARRPGAGRAALSILLAFDDERAPAQTLAAALGWELGIVASHRFPDGEWKLTLPAALPPRVVLLRGLYQPNEKLAALMIAAPAAREMGAEHLTLVCPYLAYMRQDMAFHPGEAVSQRHVGRALALWFDTVVTVDPHLHRVATLDEVVPGRRGVALSAAGTLGAFVAARLDRPLLVGPDQESAQWVGVAAREHALEHAICRKLRHGDREVDVALPEVEVAGREVVLMDDLASTGRTMIAAAQGCLRRGARSVDVAVTHGLFVGDAMAELAAAGVRHVWSTDSVPHPTNTVPLAPLLAAALRGV